MSEELRCHKLSKMLDFEVRCQPFAGRLAVRLIYSLTSIFLVADQTISTDSSTYHSEVRGAQVC